MSADIYAYTSLITSQHNVQPNFMATVAALVQPAADLQAVLNSIPALYDLDVAVGVQLDTVGQWVGQTRNLKEPITGVYFSFDTTGLGFDQGTWLGPFDPTSGLVALPDDSYRILLYATIAANSWDGTVPSAYAIWGTLFASLGYEILIQDNQDMTMGIILIGPTPNAVTLALFSGGYLNLRPAGVLIEFYGVQSVQNAPVFGFDASLSAFLITSGGQQVVTAGGEAVIVGGTGGGSSVAGFDIGAWFTYITPA
ncbi:DUF2612 domain-containing protein [Caballeronia sp. KNU42]